MSEQLTQKVMPCNGGIIRFGMTGMGNTQYAEKFSLCVSPSGHFRCTVCGNGYGMVRP